MSKKPGVVVCCPTCGQEFEPTPMTLSLAKIGELKFQCGLCDEWFVLVVSRGGKVEAKKVDE
jgi:hypothetical protein